jgi:hypothetical protein
MTETKLRKFFDPLCRAGVIALKAGTEAEKQTPAEIAWMREVTPEIGPIRIKIGGCEACGDLKALLRMGFKDFIAPMIETPFAMQKFIDAVRWATKGHPEELRLCLNLESITAFENLDRILAAPGKELIHKINVGKTDLGASMEKEADDPEVLGMAAVIVSKAKKAGMRTGVGGSINIRTISQVLHIVQPDEVETRNIVFDAKRMTRPEQSIRTALEFEGMLLIAEAEFHRSQIEELEGRKAGLERRLRSKTMKVA